MTRLALISDIHGNCVALDAVLAEVARDHVADIVCLGDIAAGGPQPREVIRRLREVGCRAVRGNGEGWLLEGLPSGRSDESRRLAEVACWARGQLPVADLEYLAALPKTLTRMLDSLTLLCFHGSPRSDVESLLATTSVQQLNDALADAPAARLLASGHTHLQLRRAWDNRMLINPGSVGLPLGSLAETDPPLPERADYAIVEVRHGEVEVALRQARVEVNSLATATAAMPNRSWAADLERRICRWNARTIG